nr:ribonuclease H-like domain-containing protein [Tanacetum cinerariifolium]
MENTNMISYNHITYEMNSKEKNVTHEEDCESKQFQRQHQQHPGLFLYQKKYALQLLERAHMVHCNPSRTPVDTESKLGPDSVPVQDPTLYRSLTRGLHAEEEYRGVVDVVAEIAWIRNLLRELHSSLLTATLVYCDNVSVVYMSANPVQHQRPKHIEINIHFVRDMVIADHVRVLHVPSRFQFSDIFTKGLPSALFEDFRSSFERPFLYVWPSPYGSLEYSM